MNIFEEQQLNIPDDSKYCDFCDYWFSGEDKKRVKLIEPVHQGFAICEECDKQFKS